MTHSQIHTIPIHPAISHALICHECKGHVRTDYKSGELYCAHCGLVLF